MLKEDGLFIVSIPNPKILHPYIYPGFFNTKNFKEFLQLSSFEIIDIKGWGQASALSKMNRWLKNNNNALSGILCKLILFFSRKRNLLMRKYIGTPLPYSYCVNFICKNHKSDKTLVEQLAEETLPDNVPK